MRAIIRTSVQLKYILLWKTHVLELQYITYVLSMQAAAKIETESENKEN